MAATSFAFRPVTLDDWADLPEDDDRELVDGVLVEAEMPNTLHEFVFAWLFRLLGAWTVSHGAMLFGSGLKFVVGRERGRMPDMSIFLTGQKRPPVLGVTRTPPSIAVEIVLSSANDERRDRIHKFAEYEQFGVPWYWLIDPELRSFEIFELGTNGKYMRMVAATEGTIDAVPGCPELTLDVSALWRDLDAYIAEAGEE
ncbi:Uma2 family endonuclease [Pendulispora albinea]|uniref:Uma2 family endonuclease n=1 Tax=Pendulispora albinea TaxID=2741071 RepID=A0ABZ2LJZ1_9BACT